MRPLIKQCLAGAVLVALAAGPGRHSQAQVPPVGTSRSARLLDGPHVLWEGRKARILRVLETGGITSEAKEGAFPLALPGMAAEPLLLSPAPPEPGPMEMPCPARILAISDLHGHFDATLAHHCRSIRHLRLAPALPSAELVLLCEDCLFPGGTAAAATILPAVQHQFPGAGMLLINSEVPNEARVPLLTLGIRGFLGNNCSLETIEAALRAVTQGSLWLSPELASLALASLLPGAARPAPVREGLEGLLSKRELEILEAMTGGLSNQNSGFHHTFPGAGPQNVQTSWDFGIMVPSHLERTHG